MPGDLRDFVASAAPIFLRLIPATPARLLGRAAAPEHLAPDPALGPSRPSEPGDNACLVALRSAGNLPAERLLGALELAIDGFDWSAAPDLTGDLPGLPPNMLYGMVSGFGQQSEAVSAAAMLDRIRPGVVDRIVALSREVAPTGMAAPDEKAAPARKAARAGIGVTGDEPAIAAAHGAAHLAVAVVVAGAVVAQTAPPLVDRAAATVGLALGAAVLLLRDTPMPSGYASALLDRIRAEYLLPRATYGTAIVSGHRFGLVEHDFPDVADFSGNGLVAVADGGVVIRTGIADGQVNLQLEVRADAPEEVDLDWDEVVEVNWHAAEGRASVLSPDGRGADRMRRETPPWPGDYRIRVHARGRDDLDADHERYRIVVWSAEPAAVDVHKRIDLLGHRLRGEPAPKRPPRPELAYRWIDRSVLTVAATVTVVTGATVEQALRAFGADPDRPERIGSLRRSGQWVSVLDAGGAVVLVEENGYRGANAGVLRAASANGRAASWYWNVNAVTRLSFAEGGELLAAYEPFGDEDWPPELAPVLAGLDFSANGDRDGKGLVAVERFTGRGLTEDDLARIEKAGVAYRIDV
ncbi:hypothetical protein GCM10010112_40670 [Actinoplanes lobatus]|uniref:Uncharacterized protein n=1 Tax=Actinoplanes lobatus TaxID=113568 RepID=A0A7W7HNK0_9ACTN|nr:DUF6461 domain-containing protein [Actinoplanes lobatus]MBB4753818.1 hypothetical protein [Actinoplanes lobatus]GGN72408.1 hypothetical protein GCM10010112_40670 [Actinoplanes lobatus]GIE42029.1 hypothetical protein Alo02nite_49270 [Actinoplanes lobatus]